jgi:hypothetical protein
MSCHQSAGAVPAAGSRRALSSLEAAKLPRSCGPPRLSVNRKKTAWPAWRRQRGRHGEDSVAGMEKTAWPAWRRQRGRHGVDVVGAGCCGMAVSQPLMWRRCSGKIGSHDLNNKTAPFSRKGAVFAGRDVVSCGAWWSSRRQSCGQEKT